MQNAQICEYREIYECVDVNDSTKAWKNKRINENEINEMVQNSPTYQNKSWLTE